MATVKKRGNSYTITVSAGYDSNGKQIRKYMTWVPPAGMSEARAEKEAEKEAVRFEDAVNAGVAHDSNIKFQAFAELWMTEHVKKQLKLRTYSGYEKRLEVAYKAIGHLKLKELRTGHLNAFYKNLEETGIRADKKYTVKIDLESILDNMKLSRTAFAKQAGLSKSTISAAIEKRRVSSESAALIAAAVNMRLSDVFSLEQPDRLLSASTVRTYHRIVSSVLGYAVEEGYIPFNPASKAKLPKMVQKEALHLDEDDARTLLTLLNNEPIKWRTAIAFDLLSGLRRGELLGLRWRDVSFDSETILVCQTSNYVPGTGLYVDTPKSLTSTRVIKLTKSAFMLLQSYKDWQDDQRAGCGDQWKDVDDRIFTADDGAPIHPDSLTKWFSEFVKRSGLPPVNVKSLRHTYSSLMIADGTPLVIVSRNLGHAQVSTTNNIYSHVIQSAAAKAVEVFDKFADVIEPPAEANKKKTTA